MVLILGSEFFFFRLLYAIASLCVHCDDHFFILIFGSVYYAVLSSTVLTFDQPLRRFIKATLISSRTYIAFWHNVHCALEDFLSNLGKPGRSCSFSWRKISRKTSGARVHKNWCSRILFRLSYHWRLGDPIIKLPPWNDAWKIFKNSCYFRCRKRYLTAGSKFYLSRYCFFSRCKKEVDRRLSSLVSIRFLLPIQLCSLVYLVSRCRFALRLFIRTSTFVETSGWQEI